MTEISTGTDGIEIALHKNGHNMKKNRQILKPRSRLSLGDLILAVSSCTKNTKETAATVAAGANSASCASKTTAVLFAPAFAKARQQNR